MAQEIGIVYDGELCCSALHAPTGATLITDAQQDSGGKGASFSPTDLVAVAIGTCVAITMGIVAKRSNIDLKGMRIEVDKEMVSKPVRRIGVIRSKITFPAGLNLDDAAKAKLERAAELCPVRQTMHPDTKIITEFIYS